MTVPALMVAVGAFIILGIMFALLAASGRRDSELDPITQQIIIKASTGPVEVNAPLMIIEDSGEEERT